MAEQKGNTKGAEAQATAQVKAKRVRGASPESRLKLALNDLLAFTKENVAAEVVAESSEVRIADATLTSLGFVQRASAAKRIAELQAKLQAIDITAADSQAQITEISKEIGKLRKV